MDVRTVNNLPPAAAHEESCVSGLIGKPRRSRFWLCWAYVPTGPKGEWPITIGKIGNSGADQNYLKLQSLKIEPYV
jgi:hypothetical protein